MFFPLRITDSLGMLHMSQNHAVATPVTIQKPSHLLLRLACSSTQKHTTSTKEDLVPTFLQA